MKIAFLHPFLLRYARGIERHTWSLAAALAQRGIQVDLMTWRWPHSIEWGRIHPGVRLFCVPYSRYFMDRLTIPFYAAWLLRGNYDWVIHFFAGYGEAEALSLVRKLHPPRRLIVFHFPQSLVPHRYQEFRRHDMVQKADLVMAVSDYVAQEVSAEFGRTCHTVGNGVDAQVFCPSLQAREVVRRRLGIDMKTPVLISVAALEERKGIQWVVQALPSLLDEFPDLRYWVIGEGAYQATLEAQVHQLALEGHVIFVGNTMDVSLYLAGADASCLLSYGEAMPIALIESMAVELPVLTSQRPPFDALVSPQWGVTVDETDTVSVARELGRLLRSPTERAEMGRAGRNHVLKSYTWDKIAKAYLELLGYP